MGCTLAAFERFAYANLPDAPSSLGSRNSERPVVAPHRRRSGAALALSEGPSLWGATRVPIPVGLMGNELGTGRRRIGARANSVDDGPPSGRTVHIDRRHPLA